MRAPQENSKGYEYISPFHFVDKISPKTDLLIYHSLFDDSIQNTAEYAQKLVQNNIQFDMHVYTNRNHNIIGKIPEIIFILSF